MNKNLWLLTLSQIFSFTAAPITVFLSGIIGSNMTDVKSLVTLPTALMIVGTSVGSIIASYLMSKTGRKFGNEIAHGQQALTYAIGTFFRYPMLEHVQTELWYLDKSETTIQAYTRDEAMVFAPGLHQRAVIMTTATEFPPNPGKDTCKWCPHKEGEHPICEWGIK